MQVTRDGYTAFFTREVGIEVHSNRIQTFLSNSQNSRGNDNFLKVAYVVQFGLLIS